MEELLVDGDLYFIFGHNYILTNKIHVNLLNFNLSYLDNYRSKKAHLDTLYFR